MGIIRIRLSKKDQILKEWYALMRESGDNASEAVILIIRYYIKTGQYMNAACLELKENDIPDCIKSAYIPEHSDVEEWLLKKVAEGTKKSALVKRILRSSISRSNGNESFFMLNTDKLFEMVEHPDSVKYTYKPELIEEKETIQSFEKEIKKEQKPLGVIRNIEEKESLNSKENDSASDIADIIEKKQPRRSNTLFNNLVTSGLKH